MVKYLAILKASRRLITICIRSHIIIYVKCNEDNISDLDIQRKKVSSLKTKLQKVLDTRMSNDESRIS